MWENLKNEMYHSIGLKMPRRSAHSSRGPYTTSSVASYATGERQCREVGRRLGRLCKATPVSNFRQFERLTTRRRHPVREVLALVLACRVNRSTSRMLFDVDRVRDENIRPRWYWSTMREAFGLYCSIRRGAVPRGRHAAFLPRGGHVTRVVQDALRDRGVHGVRNLTGKEIRKKAAFAAAARVKNLKGVPIMVWVDNLFRMDASYNPMTRGHHFQAAVVSFLCTPKLPPAPALFSIPTMYNNRKAVAAMLRRWHPRMMKLIGDAASFSRCSGNVRVPLDHQRESVESLQWTPISINEHLVQSGHSMVDGLQFVRFLMGLSGRTPCPLLVDVDVWYRLIGIVYGQRTQEWDMRAFLQDTPPLFGVWHAYKHVVIVVHRTFQTYFAFLRQGTLPVKHRLPGLMPLRTLELTIAGVLMLPDASRQAMRGRLSMLMRQIEAKKAEIGSIITSVGRGLRAPALARAREQYNELLGTLERAASEAPPTRPQHVSLIRSSPLNAHERMKIALADLGDLERERHVAEEMIALVEEWAPLCFLLGTMTRECAWGNRVPGSGARARELIMTALLAMVYLTEGAEHRAQYVRQMYVVLMTWSKWHDYIPGCLYSEEANEASLSPLGTLCRTHRRLRTVSDVMDLFLLVPLPPTGPHARPTHPPTASLRGALVDNMALFVREGRKAVTYAPWESEAGTQSREDWPDDWWTPRQLSDAISENHLRELGTYAMLTLLKVPRPLSSAMVQSLNTNIPRRSINATAAAAGVIEKVLTHEMPKRYERSGTRSEVRAPAAAGVVSVTQSARTSTHAKPRGKRTAGQSSSQQTGEQRVTGQRRTTGGQ